MFEMLKKLLFPIFFLLISFQLTAEFRTNVHSISRREGLSNGAVNTITKDAEGYIWFGTWNGLNRYDGFNMITYLPGNNSFSIHNHVIRELYPAKSGAIWILTNKGVSLYDNFHDQFTSYFTQESEQLNYENDISICHSDRFGTVVSVYGRGIFKYDSLSSRFHEMIIDPVSKEASKSIRWVHWQKDRLYLISEHGDLFFMEGNRLRLVMALPLKGTVNSSISFLGKNQPYLLLTQRSGVALLVDLEAGKVIQLAVPEDIITSFSVSKTEGRLWAGTEKGRIYSFSLLTYQFELLNQLSDLFINNPITARILCIYETDPGILWIGTDGNAVYTIKLTEFPSKSLSSNQLAYPTVRSIHVTHKGDVLIGTKGGGIDIFNNKGDHIKAISVKNGLSNNSVLSFHELQDGSIWVGTDGAGIDIISPDYKTIRNFPRDFKGTNSLGFASVYRIFEGNDQRIYLGTSGYGVIMVELDNAKRTVPISFEQLILDKSIVSPGLQKQIVYALTEEKPGLIWIGTRGAGVYRYNTITKRVIGQYSTSTDPRLIRNDDILSLYTDQEQNIWAGSSNGIFSFTPLSADSVKVNGVNAGNDLVSASIHTIQSGQPGNLWVTTNDGLSLIDVTNWNVKSFNVNDGLINFEYSDGASYFDESTNRLFVGGTMGVDIIQTDQIKFSSYFPPVAFNQLLIRNQLVEPDPNGILASCINYQKNLKLKYNQNSISFSVAPLAFWGRERHKIAYRLIKYNNEWTVISQNQGINFTNLEPGKYRLQVRVSDENGNWSDRIREINLIINSPFWLTSWAIAGYILLGIVIQLLIFSSYRRREERKKEAVLQEFKMKKEEELHNYKIEFFTNVAHEFRTPLTIITSHIHALLEDTRNTLENPRLLKVYNNSIKIQKLVLEIMQFRKLEKGKELLNIQLTKPVELIREVISDLELLAQQRKISCEIITQDVGLVFKTDADKFQRIITNLISNAVKYNLPDGYVKVYVKSDQSGLIIEVEDNGVGIKPEYAQKVFEPFGISSAMRKGSFPGYRSTGLGLAVTKGLVELLSGTITFESNPDEGTRFSCVFPDIQQIGSHEMVTETDSDFIEMNFINEPNAEKIFTAPELLHGKSLILVVDDDPEILALLKDFLQADYHIIFAENGLEAYHKIISEKPDLIVSDVMMPEMDGIELCSKLRENFDTSHLPIILLTAKEEIEDRIAGLKAGADSYIPKPFHPEHLKVRIDKLLQLRQSIKNRFGQQDSNSSLVQEISDPFFQKLLNYIDENLDDEELSAERLCDKLAISKSSLYNKTKSVLGATPHGLINQRRLNKAAIFLQSTTLSVSEIIDQTGFASRTHFYELFSKTYGCSPSDYRNRSMVK